MVKITKRIVEAGGFRSRPRSCAEVVTRRRAKRSAVWRLRCCISLIIQSQPAGASVRVADRVRQALLAPSRRRFLAMSARLRAAGDALRVLNVPLGASKKLGNNPDVGSPVTRWVYFGHLTKTQGMAGRRYADIMRKFDRFHTDTKSRTARAQNYALGSGGEDQELGRRASDGTMDQYLADARKAKRQYHKLQKVIAPFHGAKEMLDNLCILEIEPPAGDRKSCAAVLSLIAKAFGIDEVKHFALARCRLLGLTP